MKRRVAGLLGALVMLGVFAPGAAAPASAHALLAESTPADGATVDEPPMEVTLTFTESLDPLLTVAHVLDAEGTRVEVGRVEIPGAPNRARLALGALAQGVYTVTWRTTSTFDGHTTVGTVAFGVGVPAAAAGATGAATGVRPPTPIAVSGRWLFYLGAVLLVGAGTVGVLIVAKPSFVSVWLLNVAWAVAALGLVLTIADHRAATRTSLGNLLESSTGQKLSAQAIAVGLTWLAVGWASLRPSRWSLGAVGVGASAIMLQRALAGHADASTVPWFTVGTQWLHLVAVGAWVGGLAWLLVAFRRGDPGRGLGLARRFSTVALVMLVVVAVSGTLRAVDEVGAWSRMLDTSFGVTLLVKLGLFAALVALGARSRFRHVAAATAARVVGLRRTVRAEVVVGVAVLGAAAVLAGLPPSASVAEAERLQRPRGVTISGNDFATSVRVRVIVNPGSAGPNQFDATVVDYDSRKPLGADTVTLRFQSVDRADVAATSLELKRDDDSHWRGSSSALSLEGRWTVTAVVQSTTDAVEVPMELVTGRRASGPS
ncbi:MAG: copper resistance protein CopC [Acidimicrobiales bacterium]